MFVLKLRWNKKIAVSIIIIAALCAILAIFSVSLHKKQTEQDSSLYLETNDERVAYLKNLGWEVSPAPLNEKDIVIPKEFSEIYSKYNDLQRSQGFDLSEYQGMQVKLYTYTILNYPDYKGSVVADLYISDTKIIGGDIHSTSLNGFMHGLKSEEEPTNPQENVENQDEKKALT